MLFCVISAKRFVFTRGKIGEGGVCPDLAMRMWVAGAHEFAAVFEDLDVADPRNLGKRNVLLGPGVDHAAQFARVHAGNRKIVAWRETQDAADTAVGLRNK